MTSRKRLPRVGGAILIAALILIPSVANHHGVVRAANREPVPATSVTEVDDPAAEEPTVLVPDDGGVSAETIQGLVDDADLKVEEAIVVFPGDNLDLTVGVNTAGEQGASDLDDAVLATLTDMSNTNGGATYDSDLQSTLDAATSEAESGVEYSQLKLSEAPAVVPDGMTVVESNDSSDLALASDSDCGKTWWPNYVEASGGASSVAGMRYGQTKFQWSTNSRLTALKCYDDITFEPDFTTYNYDDKAYYANSIESWSTTMPNGYKDTKFMDGGDELTFTVGTSDARKLSADKEYKTYFRTKRGNSSSDKAKVFLQRGNRTPSVCHSTWCIFAKATNQYVPAWVLSLPGNVTVVKWGLP